MRNDLIYEEVARFAQDLDARMRIAEDELAVADEIGGDHGKLPAHIALSRRACRCSFDVAFPVLIGYGHLRRARSRRLL